MYSIEQLISIWGKVNPLYFKIVSGASKGGLTKFDGQKEAGEDKKAASDALLEEFQECVNMLNDGTYTVVMRSSESAARNEKIYTFKVGDGQAVGSVEQKGQAAQNGNFGGGNMNMMLFQMMMQQQQQNTALVMQMIEKNQNIEKQVWQKDLEIFKMSQGKTAMDKVVGLMEKPHVVNGIIAAVTRAGQPQAVGRAEAPPPPNNIVPSADQMERAEKLQRLLATVQAAYPNADPIDTLESGFNMVGAYLAENPQ